MGRNMISHLGHKKIAKKKISSSSNKEVRSVTILFSS